MAIMTWNIWCSLAVAVWRNKTQVCTKLLRSSASSWTVSTVYIRLLAGQCQNFFVAQW